MADSQPGKRATIYEVAAAAGVSITTVSHALNRPERVRPETRKRILEIADQLDFVPDRVAARRTRAIPQIAVLAPFDTYPTYLERLLGVLAVLGDDARVVVFDHSAADTELSPLMQALPIVDQVDGLIAMGIPLGDEMAQRLTDRALPAVLVDAEHPALSSVNVDDERGGRTAAEHLLARGHRHVAYLTGSQQSADYVSPGFRRLRGIEQAMVGIGSDLGDVPIVLTEPGFEGGRAAAEHLRRSHPEATAAICHFDEIAAGLLAGLRANGTTVPDELAVLGYDDGLLAEALDLTTVRQPFRASGELAARLLLARLAERDRPPEQLLLTPDLQPRGTT